MLTIRNCTSMGMFLLSAGVGYSALDISRYSIDGGGAMRSTGGAFELSGTIGQPDAGTLAGGSFELSGGFWFSIPPTDCNEDGLVNLQDHVAFSQCFSGPNTAVDAECACYDVNRDGEVDLRDFASAQTAHSGM